MQSRFKRWDDARLFLAVARKGSTLAASKALGITQTTVARRIDALEHALGLTLFDRDTRGFRLTEEGQALVAPAEGLEAAAETLDTAAQDLRQAQARPIRFTASDDTMTFGAAGIFAEFSATNPGVTFEFITSEKHLDLSAGEADIALRLGGNEGDQTLIGRAVGTTHVTFYASEHYARTIGTPPAYSSDMEAYTVVLLRHIPTERKNVLLCDTMAELVMAIQTGRGIGPIPTAQGDRLPGLDRCFPPPKDMELEVRLLASAAAHRRPEVRRFMAFAGPRFARFLKDRVPN